MVNLSLLELKLINGCTLMYSPYSLLLLNIMFDECLILDGNMELRFTCISCLKDSRIISRRILFADGYIPICQSCLNTKHK